MLNLNKIQTSSRKARWVLNFHWQVSLLTISHQDNAPIWRLPRLSDSSKIYLAGDGVEGWGGGGGGGRGRPREDVRNCVTVRFILFRRIGKRKCVGEGGGGGERERERDCVCVCVCVCVRACVRVCGCLHCMNEIVAVWNLNFIYNVYARLTVMLCLSANALYEWNVSKTFLCTYWLL